MLKHEHSSMIKDQFSTISLSNYQHISINHQHQQSYIIQPHNLTRHSNSNIEDKVKNQPN